ncbi:hypothetical protein CALCODRAFT_486734 [Calocera cornea HHB12733]|uniref:Zn(2)-C6 fungal-type domain-containing protein n=1 Tax=Calocera cornea HHB12733 TaxID=1353952 RepID=A0A165DJV3_9BASI|nr:hypothetical protein CALCODRAFT_486734 [Calocera cornea HHB12733]
MTERKDMAGSGSQSIASDSLSPRSPPSALRSQRRRMSEDGDGDGEREPPRKKMRKGTHSCAECRRRKVRCIYASSSAIVCNECVARGTRCVSQEEEEPVPDARKNLRERVGRLEGLVDKLLARNGFSSDDLRRTVTETGIDIDLATPCDVPQDVADRLVGIGEAAPALSLFDNAIFGRKEGGETCPLEAGSNEECSSATLADGSSCSSASSPSFPTSTASKTKLDTVRRALTRTIPSERDLDTLFRHAGGWWVIWRDLCQSIIGTDQLSLSLVLRRALDKGHPTLIAHALLCISITIQQLPGDFDYALLSLPLDADALMKHYMMLVQRLIIFDAEFASSLDGLDCMILQGKLHLNLGQPRQAWVTFRRAMSFAVLLGLHRDPVMPSDKASALWKRRRMIWWRIYEGDRYLSLLLGLPYAVNDAHCNLTIDEADEAETPELFRRRVTRLSGRVIDRNQNFNGLDLTLTLELDQEMEELGRRMPPRWWDVTQAEHEGSASHYDRLMSQYWYHQVRMLLHLPFLLRALTDARFEYSRLLCLESSRQMLRRYNQLRGQRSTGAYLCKVVDFQAFTAAVLLLLHLVGTGRLWPEGEERSDIEQNAQDSAYIDQTIANLRTVVETEHSLVAAQALEVLDSLQEARKRPSEGQKCSNKTLVIPFFGTVTIGPGSGFSANGTINGVKISSSNLSDNTPPAETTAVPTAPANPFSISVDSRAPRTSIVNPNEAMPPQNFPPQTLSQQPQVSFSSFYGPYGTEAEGTHPASWMAGSQDDMSWQSILSMDLDQNWNLTLAGMPGQVNPTPQVLNPIVPTMTSTTQMMNPNPQVMSSNVPTSRPTLGAPLSLPNGI